MTMIAEPGIGQKMVQHGRKPQRSYSLADPADARSDDRREVVISAPNPLSQSKARALQETVNQVSRILHLDAGWDGAVAARVSATASTTLVRWVDLLLDSECAVAPQVFALVNGGVQAEWLVAGESLEIEVGPTGDVGILGMDADGETLVEGDFPNDLPTISFVDDARRLLVTFAKKMAQ